MSYAQDRECWDADSHLMPEKDFLSKHAESDLREALEINGGNNGGAGFEKWFGKILDDVHARLQDPEKTAALIHDGWLDTGDLAYIVAGELFITGRSNDLIIRAGRNILPR